MTTVAFLASDVAGDRGVTLLDVYSIPQEGRGQNEGRALTLYSAELIQGADN